jgi:Coenzyme PQQ synthesis protein D (PqqD)
MRRTTAPPTRRDGLIVLELEDETLVYDRESHEAHCLNRTAALIWKHCNGRLTVAEITKLLANELHGKVDEQVVWLALSQLSKKQLLADQIPRQWAAPRITRREMAHRLAQAVVIATPIIATIIAPTPATAGSCSNCGPPPAICCAAGCPCQGSAICCSGVCSSGSCT